MMKNDFVIRFNQFSDVLWPSAIIVMMLWISNSFRHILKPFVYSVLCIRMWHEWMKTETHTKQIVMDNRSIWHGESSLHGWCCQWYAKVTKGREKTWVTSFRVQWLVQIDFLSLIVDLRSSFLTLMQLNWSQWTWKNHFFSVGREQQTNQAEREHFLLFLFLLIKTFFFVFYSIATKCEKSLARSKVFLRVFSSFRTKMNEMLEWLHSHSNEHL